MPLLAVPMATEDRSGLSTRSTRRPLRVGQRRSGDDLTTGKLTPRLSDRIADVRGRQRPTLRRHSVCGIDGREAVAPREHPHVARDQDGRIRQTWSAAHPVILVSGWPTALIEVTTPHSPSLEGLWMTYS